MAQPFDAAIFLNLFIPAKLVVWLSTLSLSSLPKA